MSNVKKLFSMISVATLLLVVFAASALGCTIVAVGNEAMIDNSTIITHNDDSTTADYRLWIIPEHDWSEGSVRKIVYDSHNYEGGTVVGEMPQVAHTYRYFHSRYSFMNEMGVAMGEATFSYDRNTDREKDIYNVMVKESDGIIDCWFAQDIALERAKTAREAVQIMGNLVETYGWAGPGETINITDGKEVWIAEFYGRDIWAAVRIPNDHFFVAANRARIGEIDMKDSKNYMFSPNIKSFAIEKGWYNPKSGKPFLLYDAYAPCDGAYSTRREWRAFDLVAPSLKLDSHATRFPFSVKPERKLTVHDIFKIKGDYYQGTEYDLTKGPAAGPWGDPIRIANRGTGAWERSINMHRTCYVHIGQVKAWLPEPIRGISWYGYGAPDTTYLTPLWPAMLELPAFYSKGTRYEAFQRDSGWWTNTYVQQMTELHYNEAIKDVYAFRDPKMEMLYAIVPQIQELAAKVYKTDPEAAINIISQFAYMTAEAWHEDWLRLGDFLLGKYAMGYINFQTVGYPAWWNELVGYTEGVNN